MKSLLLACAALLAGPAFAPAYADDAALLTPAKPGWPLAHPIATADIPTPPFSLPTERGVKPAYVASLPGLPQGRKMTDDFGRETLKYDGVFIRGSRVENGEVVIPPGGLAYLEDTWGGEVALRGEKVPMLGRDVTYVDYDMSIVVKHDVTIPAGQAVAVGGTVYQYYATVGHEQMANNTLHVKTIAGTDWEWAFGSPVLSAGETGWWGDRFAQLYNQGQAREIKREAITFDWLSGVRMDRMLYATDPLFAGLAGAGDSWKVGGRELRVAAVDETAGTVTLELLADSKVTVTRVLGPVQADRLIEDDTARKALVFEDGDMVAFLSPWPKGFDGGKASLKVYGGAFALGYGADYARDPRFASWPVGCPTGHSFGYMLTNKDEIRLRPGEAYAGPEGYFKVVVDAADGAAVTAWHVEDRDGNRSINLGGPEVANVDLVLGQGRVAGQAILKDIGRAMLTRAYGAEVALQNAAAPEGAPAAAPVSEPPVSEAAVAPAAGLTPALGLACAVLALASGAVGYEVARRGK
ncbi:hypothetical protein [Amaricoccus solimangrovi]|uniref:Uncharacterized protein n=1 Tax=Amaricoccus solimangrovi TaxID=2589815 RepID=A0A501WJX1_9RHOB|nr:hypothetical protein [Amaricoccus solimangrovi]TPE47331.1 hypothetical protein FJM51_20345 [Amaricoccus solimangrovi]